MKLFATIAYKTNIESFIINFKLNYNSKDILLIFNQNSYTNKIITIQIIQTKTHPYIKNNNMNFDKKIVVIDNGTGYTKMGYAGNS